MQETISSNGLLKQKLMTAREVAAIIGCSAKTVYSWAETGYAGIPAIKFGEGRKSLLRFDPEKIKKWIQSWEKKSGGKDV